MRPYLLAYLLIASTSWAQSTPGDDLRLERIDSSSGLSHNSVYSLLQDRQGFMWIGTVDGLNRYDGHEFLVYRYDPSDPTSLSNNLVNVLFEDQGGSLWVGTEDGLNRFDRARDRFTRYSLLPDNPEAVQEIIHAIFEDRSGALWIGTSLGLFRYHPSQDRLLRLSGFDDHAFLRIQEDAEGNLWTLTVTAEREAFLNRLGPRQGLAQQLRLAGEWGLVSTFFIDRTGDFWLNPSGPARLERDVAYPSTLSPWRSVSWAILQGRNGNVWIGSGGEGLIRYDPTDQTFERILMDPSPDAYLGNYVRSLWEDQAGALWIGTQGGLYRYDPHRKPFAHWKHDASDPNTMSHNHVSAIYEATDGMLWIGTFGGGLNRIDRAEGTVTRYRHRQGDRTSLRHDVVWDIKGGNQGQLWLATSDGLCEYDPRRDRFIWHDLRLPSGDVRQHRVQFIERARDETLWIASHFGLYQYDPQTGEARVYGVTGDDRGPSHDYIEALLLDRDGILWIGTGTQHINKLDTATGAFTHYPLLTENGESLHSEGIWDIHLASSGHLWLGTGTGLTRFDPASEGFRHYYVQDGLPGSVVYAILEDDEGRLWLGTNKGIARFDDRLPSDRNFRQYDVLDGIGSTEFNRHSAFKNDRGELLFGGMDGLTTFFPDAIRDNPHAPPVVLTRLERYNADGVLAIDPSGLDGLTLSYRDYALAFEFATLNYANPQKSRHRYMLEGFDKNWVEAGAGRLARYTNVPPGDYVFRVRGANNDGVWNEDGASIRVTITPPLWQRWWFRLLAVGLIVGLLRVLYRYRVAKLLELERLRLRIAADLHDDLSSDLSGIAVVTDMMQKRDYLHDEERRSLKQVRQSATSMVDKLRDIVWYITPEHDNLPAMVRRMRSVAGALLGSTKYRFDAPSTLRDVAVDMSFRRNVFLIYKEALHNAARHSRCELVSIEISQTDGLFEFRIADDGVGFDPETSDSGHGLRNIRQRADQIAADVNVASRPGAGTTVTMAVKIPKTRDTGGA